MRLFFGAMDTKTIFQFPLHDAPRTPAFELLKIVAEDGTRAGHSLQCRELSVSPNGFQGPARRFCASGFCCGLAKPKNKQVQEASCASC